MAIAADHVEAFVRQPKQVDLAARLRRPATNKVNVRVPIEGARIGGRRADLALFIDPDHWWQSSCQILCGEERVRGINYRPSYEDPEDPARLRTGWHEHRWDDARQDRDHHPLPELDDADRFQAVIRWVERNWNLVIEGQSLLPASLWGY
jgi:hypothetical protein